MRKKSLYWKNHKFWKAMAHQNENPLIIFIGTGKVFAETPPTYLYNGNPNSFAAAFATQEKHLK
jgi:hypothetical protein